jgi:hypothetical protein
MERGDNMTTEKQKADIEVPNGFELKTKGELKKSDRLFINKSWVLAGELSLRTRYAIVGKSIGNFKVPVAEEIRKL